MRAFIETSADAARHLGVWLVWQATGTSLIEDRGPLRAASGGSPAARCARTGLWIPECSCPRCIEDQLRRHPAE
jgi:hypothetical protein